MKRSMIAVGLITLGFFCAACSLQKAYDDPVAMMLDREADLSWRLRAMEQAGRRASGPRYESALLELIWADRHPFELRRVAMDQLISRDADYFWRIADRRLAGVDHMGMLAAICEQTAPGNADGRRDAIPALIKSWARPTPEIADDQRPEYRAITTLAGGDAAVLATLTSILRDEEERYDLSHEAAAWRIINRRTDAATARSIVLDAPQSVFEKSLSVGATAACGRAQHGQADEGTAGTRPWRPSQTRSETAGLLRDLTDAMPVLDPLPVEPEQIAWLVRLQRERPDDWRVMRDAVEALTNEQRDGLQLRHLPAVLRCVHQRSRSREDLKHALYQRFRGLPLTPRGRDMEGEEYVKPMPERFGDYADQLVWGDLVVIEQLLDALTDDALRLSLFELAEADRLDESAEHGGVLTWEPPEPPESPEPPEAPASPESPQLPEGDAVVARAFASNFRGAHDRVFISSQSLVEATQLGLAHFHFHAQQHDNAAYAGPGGGDLRFAQRMGFNCVVFTFVDPQTLAVDYYQPGGVVVDLGVIRRPQ